MSHLTKKLLVLSILSQVTLHGVQALNDIQTFTQPDGSTFQGRLNGDASLNWIESNGKLIKKSHKDSIFYIVTIGVDGFVFTKEVAKKIKKSTIQKGHSVTKLDEDTEQELYKLFKKKHKGFHAR